MEIFATIVMLAWIPAVMLLFAVLPARRAVIVAFLAAWLFLPVVQYSLPFFPDYTKMSATCAGVFAGALVFDAKRILRFRPHWVDLPILIYCVWPFLSCVTNGLGTWDGVSRVMYQILTWGLPYLIGRCYFTTSSHHRELAVSMVIGGLIYVPLCLIEMRMSPLFHKFLYGFTPRGIQMRFGAWRPSVFMDHGLTVGMWMTAVSLIGIWLWRTGSFKELFGVPAKWWVLLLLLTTVLCRSTGALALLVVGLGVLWICRHTKTRFALACLIAIAPTYIALRASGLWHGEELVALAKIVSEDRASSLQFRIKNEDLLLQKALYRPLFGWGGWGRNRVYDQFERDVSVTDGRWIIDLGVYGVIGMAGFFAALLAPVALLARRYSARRLLSAELAPSLALAVVVSLYAIDSIPNAMTNPLFLLAAGAVAGIAASRHRVQKATQTGELPSVATGRFADCVPPRRPYPQPNTAMA